MQDLIRGPFDGGVDGDQEDDADDDIEDAEDGKTTVIWVFLWTWTTVVNISGIMELIIQTSMQQ